MPRMTKEQIDEEILETAAALFARHGIGQTSLQRVADAVGYSKTGLLHRFPTKEALEEATVAHAVERVERIAARVSPLPPGPARDRAVLEALADLAEHRPGLVSFLLTALSQGSAAAGRLDVLGEVVFRSFGAGSVPAGEPLPPEAVARGVRITSAIGGLAVTSLAFSDLAPGAVRPHLLAAALSALGHPDQED
ncbi:AcrR family transcriptional regulator [Kineococcus radiotolerans]|uniref:AcrR family transcriptional regulator n=2 Tax=Kineococcus radiotolerans TaxID=131568 RepID=A0A7W4XW19_KINRA|nr:AcrR family transcriptional regulator [Kineococcus radiotolerans]